MSKNKKKKSYALEISLVIVAVLAAFLVQKFVDSTNPPEVPESDVEKVAAGDSDTSGDEVEPSAGDEELRKVPAVYSANLTDLSEAPDWNQLEEYQFTITREDFVRLLGDVYTINEEWKKWIEVSDDYATIRTHLEDESRTYQLHFSNAERQEEVVKYWRKKGSIKLSDGNLPLEGLRVLLDPGHIGGNFASIEERKFKFNETAPVQEGNLSLIVAKHLETQLEALGAEVDLTRYENEPVNPKRARDYAEYARLKMEANNKIITEDTLLRESEKLFYRAGEIRERAKVVNTEYKPDIAICIHFNAVSWDESELVQAEHAHLILHGAYTNGELAKDDQRFQLMKKLLQRNHQEELELSIRVANKMAEHTGLPPYEYEPNSRRALNVDGNPYLWARNLAANRSFDCPVIFCEPYLMNGADSHTRIQAGDYEGLRYVNGLLRPSIFREYVNFLADGLVDYYYDREIEE